MEGIYIIKNKVNNKVYVGQSTNLEKRILSHFSFSRSRKAVYPLYGDIRKYGEENFDAFYVEIIEEKLSYWDLTSKLDELEGQYIDKYDSTNPEKGYNHNRRNIKSKMKYQFKIYTYPS